MPERDSDTRGWLFPLFFLGLIALWLAIFRPALHPSPYPWVAALTILVAFCSLFFAEWLVHDFFFASVAAIILMASTRPAITSPASAIWLTHEALFLGFLGLNLLGWERLHFRKWTTPFTILWALVAVAGWTVLLLSANTVNEIWADAPDLERQFQQIRHARLAQITCFLGLFAPWFGMLLARTGKGKAQSKLEASPDSPTPAKSLFIPGLLFALTPLLGYGIAQIIQSAPISALTSDARWLNVPTEIFRAITQAEGSEELMSWTWANVWVVTILGVLGWIRMIFRGNCQRKKGRMPFGWLLAATVTLGFATCLTTQVEPGSLILLTFGILLSVFAIADLGLLFIEKIQLGAPEERCDER